MHLYGGKTNLYTGHRVTIYFFYKKNSKLTCNIIFFISLFLFVLVYPFLLSLTGFEDPLMTCYGYGDWKAFKWLQRQYNTRPASEPDSYNMGTAKIACYCSEHNKRSVKLWDKLPGNDSTIATNKIKFSIFMRRTFYSSPRYDHDSWAWSLRRFLVDLVQYISMESQTLNYYAYVICIKSLDRQIPHFG